MANQTKLKILFKPENIEASVEQNGNLLKAATSAGVHINASCGGEGVCGTCKVLIEKGEIDSRQTSWISDNEYSRGIRQACQSTILGDITVVIPEESRLEPAVLKRELADEGEGHKVIATGWEFKPPVRKVYLEMKSPELKDNTSDLARLMMAMKKQIDTSKVQVEFGVVRKLAGVLRDGNWKVTATLLKDGDRLRLINVEPGDTRNRLYLLVFDIGTTGVRGQLLDLNRGKVIASGIEYNRQISYGEDVISRINCCRNPGGLKSLQKAVVDTLNKISIGILRKARVENGDVSHIIVAGNTTMTQLLLGLDPKYIRLSPYVPTASSLPLVTAVFLGIKAAEYTFIYVTPSVASYVGGDIVAGVLGTGIYQRKELTLYIDIGTNGEIVIGNSEWMVTASCSAGPAFEGGGIKHGMLATTGAIENFEIEPVTFKHKLKTISNSKPKGICGAGLISIVAGLFTAGIIDGKGKFKSNIISKNIRKSADGYEYVLCRASESGTGSDITINEVDIENLVRAKGAIYAGCQTLIKSIGASCQDIEQAIVAGTFGSNIDIEKAITIGLLPDLDRNKFIFIGNGSLLGARLTAYSSELVDKGQQIAGMMTNIELSDNADFMGNYIAALFLPHTNIDYFPSVKSKITKINHGVKA